MRVAKPKAWCLEGGEEGWWGSVRSQRGRWIFKSVARRGCAAAGAVPASPPRGVCPSVPVSPRAARGVTPRPPATLPLAGYRGRQPDPSRAVPQPLLQLIPPARARSVPGAFWSGALPHPGTAWGKGVPGAAGWVSGLCRDRDPNCQLPGGCGGVTGQGVAAPMAWFGASVLRLSGLPCTFDRLHCILSGDLYFQAWCCKMHCHDSSVALP